MKELFHIARFLLSIGLFLFGVGSAYMYIKGMYYYSILMLLFCACTVWFGMIIEKEYGE